MRAPREGEIHRRLRCAAEDLAAAQVLMESLEVAPRQVCLLCQQSVEKHLKAVLVERGVRVPRTHGLVELRTLGGIEGGVEVAEGASDALLEKLTSWTATARYPGDWPDAATTDANEALETATLLQEAVLRYLDETDRDRP